MGVGALALWLAQFGSASALAQGAAAAPPPPGSLDVEMRAPTNAMPTAAPAWDPGAVSGYAEPPQTPVPPGVESDPYAAASGGYCYVGPHPADPRVTGDASWDPTEGQHLRPYAPIDLRLFSYRDGCYYFIGDPRDFGYGGQVSSYYGAHPVLAAYGGGWCFMMGGHSHLWAPWSPYFTVVGSWYYWRGPYDPYFWTYWPYYSTYYRAYYPHYYGGGRFYQGGGYRPAPFFGGRGYRPSRGAVGGGVGIAGGARGGGNFRGSASAPQRGAVVPAVRGVAGSGAAAAQVYRAGNVGGGTPRSAGTMAPRSFPSPAAAAPTSAMRPSFSPGGGSRPMMAPSSRAFTPSGGAFRGGGGSFRGGGGRHR